MNNISAYGLELNLIASTTFPAGISISQFADDVDVLDVPSLQIADSATGINGDLIVWSKANPIKINVGVVAGSQDDVNLGILLEVNRPGKNKLSFRDEITMNIRYPDGTFVQLTTGIITDGFPFSGAQSTGRLKTKVYSFTFENRIGG